MRTPGDPLHGQISYEEKSLTSVENSCILVSWVLSTVFTDGTGLWTVKSLRPSVSTPRLRVYV